ncbi:unnamed protein product [Tetraodon nigroviridis]|uniref:Caveolin n=1 Tax=Tetraodon nigroviridis TaxID=99883 RepID=Q4RS85_TETNG|nr:caveolin 2 [Tetraodon nigroviridis]CAG08747.1 unnamed protein product [Tetraodon nigroviridis]
MGLEKEKLDTSIIMDEDEFNRSIEPILSQKAKASSSAPDRDPHDLNAQLKVGFEDVIAEPASAHSFDRVWIGSHAVFELVKFIFYRLLTTLLAVPVAFLLGVAFGALSCIHIWLVMPLTRSFLVLLPSVQVVWRSVTELFITPLFLSLGKSLSSIDVRSTET